MPITLQGPPLGPSPLAHTVVSAYLPEGTVLTPPSDRFDQDPDLLVHLGKHPDTTPGQRAQLRAMLARHKTAFAYSLADLVGYHGAAGPMTIIPLSAKRAFTRPRLLSPIKKVIEDTKNRDLEACGIISPAPYATSAAVPTFAVQRAPDGQYTDVRLCYNYRPQNELTMDQHTHYPIAEDLFREIGDCKFFSKIDLRSGFYQIPVQEDCKDLTGFWWGTNLYRFNRMPFGLKQSPATFQRVMDLELGRAGLLGCAKVFLDDILIHSSTFEEHLRHIELVLQCLLSCGLRAHPEKSSFLSDAMEFLGFDVSNFGLTPQVAKVKALLDMPHPTNLEELRCALGKLRYYGCFCDNFSARARPMLDLLKGGARWEWDPATQGAAFDDIRNEIATEGKALRRFDPLRPAYVHTDFSNRGLGAVLGQIDDEGREYMVACISRTLNKHERNYSSYKGECLAAVWACRTLRPYIHGLPVVLVTDHKPLKWLLTTQDLEGVMARWACILQEFDVTVVHRDGDLHQNADALSRLPLPDDSDRSGARLDHDLAPAAVAATAVATPLRYHQQVLEGPPAQHDVRITTALDTFPHTAAWSQAVRGEGVVLYEPCGGLCAGLEATLRNGVRVRRYIYSDISEPAQEVAKFRLSQLQASYPGLLAASACQGAFNTLPMDIHQCTPDLLVQAGATHLMQWLVIAGPECKDFSPAGLGRGIKGRHSRTLHTCVQIVGALQQLQGAMPPLFIIENAAMQFNFRSPRVRLVDFPEVCAMIGTPVLLDAAQVGARAHRLRNFWQNLAPPDLLEKTLAVLHREPGIRVDDILDPGRHSAPVVRDDALPYYPANKIGQPRSALPTLMAYSGSRAFLKDCPGSIYDATTGSWGEPNPDERERALGYETGTTAAPGLSPEERHIVTGNCIDQAALSSLLRACVTIAVSPTALERVVYHRVYPLPASVCSVRALKAPTQRNSQAALRLVLAIHSVEHADTPDVTPQPTAMGNRPQLAPDQLFRGHRRLTKKANEPGEQDIFADLPALDFLLKGVLPEGPRSARSTRRILRRSHGYRATTGVDGLPTLRRVMANGTLRIVPPPEQRGPLINRAHELGGHFGARRTAHLLLGQYWWRGIQADIISAVSKCEKCDRVSATFSSTLPVLSPHPINGLFYCWGVDTSGPYPVTRQGNAYILHAIEYFSATLIAVPMPNKESASTAYAFRHAILSRFGACAQVVTDGGTEYQGDFDSLMTECGIDHRSTSPNHPQANGLVERTVATIKRALRKHCESVLNVDTWDLKLPMVVLAYNCSKQSSTKVSPYHLLYAREPIFPSGEVQRHLTPALDFPSGAAGQQLVADDILARAAFVAHATPMIANNIAIAHHKDTLRYAHTRSGSYKPRQRVFSVGDLVYPRRRNTVSSLQTEAKRQILQITAIDPHGSVQLQGRCGTKTQSHIANLAPCHLPHIDTTICPEMARPSISLGCEVCSKADDEAVMLLCDGCATGWHIHCLVPQLPRVPEGMWICPNCSANGLKADMLGKPTYRDWKADAGDKMFSKPDSQARTASMYHNKRLYKVVTPSRGAAKRVPGVVTYRGATCGPNYLLISYEDGTEQLATARTARKLLKDFPGAPS